MGTTFNGARVARLVSDLRVLPQPGTNFIVVSNHHKLHPVRFEEQEHDPEAAGNAELERFVAQMAEAEACRVMRFSKGLHQLPKALLQNTMGSRHVLSTGSYHRNGS